MRLKISLLLILSFVLSACSGLKDTSEPPTELQDFTEQYRANVVWKANTGDGVGKKLLAINPVISGESIYTIDAEGLLRSYQKDNGKKQWSKDLDVGISSAFGVNETSLFVTTTRGDILSISQQDGTVQWKRALGVLSLVPPVVDGGVIVVKTLDGGLSGLSDIGGDVLWRIKKSAPTLALRTGSAPTMAGGAVFVGMDNGRLLALSAGNGRVAWELPVSLPQGNTDLERMRDVDASPIVDQNVMYAASYQGRVLALNFQSGRTLWEKPLSTYKNMALDSLDGLLLTDERSQIWSLNKTSGRETWTQDKLRARRLTAPAVTDNYLVLVGDYDGYIHMLDTVNGKIVGRARFDDEPYQSNLLVDGSMVYALDSEGRLTAFTVEAVKSESK